MRRHKLVQEIIIKARLLKLNETTLIYLLATMTDKKLTIFHKEIIDKC
jgi:hypothetical protein